MEITKTTMKHFTVVIALLAVVAIWFVGGARRAQAVTDSTEFTAPIGITFGQTARLSVLNSGNERGFVIDWRFLDSQGRDLARTTERQILLPGQMRIFDLNADDLNAPRDRFGRVQVRAVVRALGGPDTKNLHVSLEVFDNATGKTMILSPAVIKGFNPQPDPPVIQQ